MAIQNGKFVWGNPPTGGYEGHWQNSQPLTNGFTVPGPAGGSPTALNTNTQTPKRKHWWDEFLPSGNPMIGIPSWIWYMSIFFLAIFAVVVVRDHNAVQNRTH